MRRFQPLLDALRRAICEALPVRAIAIFGSLARGPFTKTSDIDFIVVSDAFPRSYSARLEALDDALTEVRRSRAYRMLQQRGYHVTFNPVAYRSEDLLDTPPLLLDVSQDALILEDDGCFAAKLKQLRGRLRELGARRVWTRKGSWYWVLKPDLQPGEVIEI